MPHKLKLDEAGHVVVVSGKPVYVDDDTGREVEFDYSATLGTITRLNNENRMRREQYEAAAQALKLYEGIEDPAAARKAMETVKGLTDKQLVDAGEVERVKAEAIRAIEEKYAPVAAERDGLKSALTKEIIGGSFARSKFITDRLAVPGDMVEAMFGGGFTVEEGKIVAKDRSGNQIYSDARPGEVASFDEALEKMVAAYPHRDSIMRGTGASGSGAHAGNGAVGAKTISREAWNRLDPMAQREAITTQGMTLVD
jgi:hypothetical protein